MDCVGAGLAWVCCAHPARAAIVSSTAAAIAGKFLPTANHDLDSAKKSARLAEAIALEGCFSPEVPAACFTCLDFADWTRASKACGFVCMSL
jgi:hypothetical protein